MPVSPVQPPGVFPVIRCSFTVVFLCALVLGLSGCKYWYKPGSTAAELQRDEDSCRAQTGAENSTPEFIDCMYALGWSTNNAPAQGDQAKVVPARPDVPARSTRSEPSQPESVPDVAPVPAKQSAEPHVQNSNVTSWWKFGGSSEQLARDQNTCLGKLEKNSPHDDIVWEASAELQKCMRDRGWRSVH